MRIAFIGQKGIPAAKPGGIDWYVEELAIRLAERGHEVFVYTRDNYTDKRLREYVGVKLVHLPGISEKKLGAITFAFFATVHALFRSYDVIHYHLIGAAFPGFLIKIFAPKTVLVATAHSQNQTRHKRNVFAKAILKFAERMAGRIPDKIIAISQTLGRFIKEKIQRDAVVIPNGFSVSETEAVNEIEKWGLKKNEYLFSAGRIAKQKGTHCLIEAYQKLYNKNLHKGKKLVISGSGNRAKDYVKLLKNLAAGNKSIIFTGVQSGEALNQLFSHAYLFIQTSEKEELSIALLEAMGYGKTALVSSTQENMEAIGSNGFAFRTGDAKDLEEKLKILLNDPVLVRKNGKLARAEVSRKYDWEKITTQTESLYKSLINNKLTRKQYEKYA